MINQIKHGELMTREGIYVTHYWIALDSFMRSSAGTAFGALWFLSYGTTEVQNEVNLPI